MQNITKIHIWNLGLKISPNLESISLFLVRIGTFSLAKRSSARSYIKNMPVIKRNVLHNTSHACYIKKNTLKTCRQTGEIYVQVYVHVYIHVLMQNIDI